jgi:hypothetical protein
MNVDTSPMGEGEVRASANAFRSCGWCSKSLNGKRPNAKFCAASCRVSFSRAGKRPRLTSAERSRCLDCTPNRSCYLHATKPARGRVDTTYPLPLFNPGSTKFAFMPKPKLKSSKESVDRHFSVERPILHIVGP